MKEYRIASQFVQDVGENTACSDERIFDFIRPSGQFAFSSLDLAIQAEQ
jgi:hypothetical protein